MPEISPSATILGLDFGLKRIGVAVGQGITRTANPQITIKNQSDTMATLQTLVQQWHARAFVIGLPLDKDGGNQPILEATQTFCHKLERHFGLPLFMVDERYSSISANTWLKRHPKQAKKWDKDSIAAKIILESWLEQTFG